VRAWFNERPVWRRSEKKGLVELYLDWCFFIDHVPYWVPAGYDCDGASIPRPLWSITGSPYHPRNLEAAFSHDPLYWTHAVPRKVADEVARQLWMQSGHSKWAAGRRYRAVRTPIGAWAWRRSKGEAKELLEMRTVLSKRPDRAKFETLWFATEQ
jgi:hypothetical protein